MATKVQNRATKAAAKDNMTPDARTMRPAEEHMMAWLGMTRQSRDVLLAAATDSELEELDAAPTPADLLRICARISNRQQEGQRDKGNREAKA